MTSIFDADGKNIPCTVVEAGPCVVTQVKTEATDGYNAIQLAFDEKRKNTPLQGLKVILQKRVPHQNVRLLSFVISDRNLRLARK